MILARGLQRDQALSRVIAERMMGRLPGGQPTTHRTPRIAAHHTHHITRLTSVAEARGFARRHPLPAGRMYVAAHHFFGLSFQDFFRPSVKPQNSQ
jgi:hypothetical protein